MELDKMCIRDSHGCVYGCIKADGIVGTGNVQINGSGNGDGVNSKGRQFLSTLEGPVTADDDQTVNAVFT